MSAWIPRLALAVIFGALPAGCGGNEGSANDTARDAAEAYVQARNQGDAGKVCELYSDELIQKLGASNCEAFVKEQTAGVATSFTLVSVREAGDQATATLQATAAGEPAGGGRIKIRLVKQGDEWKITDIAGGGPD